MPLVTEYDNVLITDRNIVDRNLISVIFISLNWLIFGFSLCQEFNGKLIFTGSSILSENESITFSILFPIGGLIGALLTSLLGNTKIGNKHIALIGNTIHIFGWFFQLIIFAIDGRNVNAIATLVLLSRFLHGISCGIIAIVIPAYVSESALYEQRYNLNIYPPLLFSVGMFLFRLSSYILIRLDHSSSSITIQVSKIDFATFGYTLAYIPIIGISLAFIILILSMFSIEDIESEDWQNVVLTSLYDPMIGEAFSFRAYFTKKLSLLRQKHLRNELILSVILIVFQQMVGFNTIINHGVTIISNLVIPDLSPVAASLLSLDAAIIYLVGTVFGIIVAKYLKRRKLFYYSSIIIGVINMNIIYILKKDIHNTPYLFFLSIVYIFIFSFSWGTITWIILSEIFAREIKFGGYTTCSCMLWIFMFFINLAFRPFYKLTVIFYIYTILAFISILAINYLLPETGNKSMEAIQNIFKENHL